MYTCIRIGHAHACGEDEYISVFLTITLMYICAYVYVYISIDVILQRSFGSRGAERGSSSPPEGSAVPMPAR